MTKNLVEIIANYPKHGNISIYFEQSSAIFNQLIYLIFITFIFDFFNVSFSLKTISEF